MRPLAIALREIAGVVPASRLERPAAAMVSSGVAEVDALTSGLPRGGLTEICGPTSSGRTTIVIAALAAATAREELCALIDVTDCFDPRSAELAGVNLEKLLWVRCTSDARSRTRPDSDNIEPSPIDVLGVKRALAAKQRTGTIMPPAKVWYGRAPARSERSAPAQSSPIREAQNREAASNLAHHKRHDPRRASIDATEQALKAADLILQSGGFGLVVLDMGDVPVEIVRRIPLASWFRFTRAVENTPTVLLTIEQEPCAKTCASMVLKTQTATQISQITNIEPTHARVFAGIQSVIEVARSRIDAPKERTNKKPPCGVRAEFASQTEWANKSRLIG